MNKSYVYLWTYLVFLILLPTTVPAAADADLYEPVAGLYETRTIQLARRPKSSNQRWYLWRTTNKVETLEGDGTSGEIWLRDPKDNIFLRQLFHKARRIIEYTPGDLRTVGRYPEWEHRAQLIDPGLLSRLKRTGSVTVSGNQAEQYQAERYQGQLNGVDIEIWWLSKYRLPALVRRVNAGSEVSVHLLELHPLATSPWKSKDVSDYQSMDYADMGDNESDPFIANLSHHDDKQHASHRH